MREIQVSENEAGQRLDKLLAKFLKEAPKSFLYKMLRKKNIILNGKRASGSEKLLPGDVIRLFLSDETIEAFSRKDPPVSAKQDAVLKMGSPPDILYEDAHILLLNKPVGMLSQKAKEGDVSAVEYVIQYLLDSGQLTKRSLQTFHPAVCNRLDRNTSGILAAGKSLKGLQELSRFFKERTVTKHYLCLVQGKVKEAAAVSGYLCKDPCTNRVQIFSAGRGEGTKIETAYRPLAYGKDLTLLEVHLITGKTHQIRAQLAAKGHPIIGDYKYGNQKCNTLYKKKYGLQSQLLHAWKLRFPESDGALKAVAGREFTAPLPEVFEIICDENLP